MVVFKYHCFQKSWMKLEFVFSHLSVDAASHFDYKKGE